jgi:hypothetical protein
MESKFPKDYGIEDIRSLLGKTKKIQAAADAAEQMLKEIKFEELELAIKNKSAWHQETENFIVSYIPLFSNSLCIINKTRLNELPEFPIPYQAISHNE